MDTTTATARTAAVADALSPLRPLHRIEPPGTIDGGDVPVVLGITMVVVIVYVVANLFVDLSYGWFDPRIRTARSDSR